MLTNYTYDLTVIIVVYKRTEFIWDALHSVISQSVSPYRCEVIVVSDTPVDIPLKNQSPIYAEYEVKSILDTRSSYGLKVANASRIAKGKIISILDDDDIFMPGKLRRIIDEFDKDPNLCYIHNGLLIVKSNRPVLKERSGSADSEDLVLNMSNVSANILKYVLTKRLTFNGSSISFLRNIFGNDYSPLEELEGTFEDFVFWYCLFSKKNLKFIFQIYTIYRQHSGNNSSTWFKYERRRKMYLRHYSDWSKMRQFFIFNRKEAYKKFEALFEQEYVHRYMMYSLSTFSRREILEALAHFVKTYALSKKWRYLVILVSTLSLLSPFIGFYLLSVVSSISGIISRAA